MFNLLNQTLFLSPLKRWIGAAQPKAAGNGSGVANSLMESSQARGVNPHQAEELRLAARAYLSVVR